ncbi:MAG: hypothetical protein LBP28_01385, partial [Coriobacteriales bacterium]|nr:hypothetical protein [Coriobacteriales bacterium]
MINRRLPGDWDIATSATPEQVDELFAGARVEEGDSASATGGALVWQVIPTGLKHGTVTLLARHAAAAGNDGSGDVAPACPDADRGPAVRRRRDRRDKNRDCNAGIQKSEVTTFRRDGD